MRVLLDTNVIIQSEDNVELSQNTQDLHQLTKKHRIQLFVHRQNRSDLLKDKDDRRRKITLAKMGKYPVLEFAQAPSAEFNIELGRTSTLGSNDFIDDCLLFALKSHAIRYLISEDKGVHVKARRVGLEDRVFYITEFIDLVIKEQFEKATPMLPAIEEVEISVLNLNDAIFDSLKSDYPGFTGWFQKKAEEGRRSWIMRRGESLAAVCIFDPKNHDCNNGMKICTFKVSDLLQGMRAGEHLLKQAIMFAIKRGILMMRVEVFADKSYLISWLEDFGFRQINSSMKGGREELVFQKNLEPITAMDSDPLETAIAHYPFLPEPPHVHAFVVPIQPQFTHILFPELVVQGSLWLSSCGHAIRKAYVCNSNITSIRKGDLLLFYESQQRRAIFARGVIDDVLRSNDLDEMSTFIAKRSVYSTDDIQEKISKGETLALKFYQSCLPMNIVPYQTLEDMRILNAAPQSIVQLADSAYSSLHRIL